MLLKGTKSTTGLNEQSAGILWVHKTEDLEFNTGNIIKLMFIMPL